jgi:MFS family permease
MTHMKSLWNPRQRILLWLACSAIFFEAFDVSIVNLALPLIAKDLRIPLATAQWVQTIYLLSFGGFLLLGGRLCDHAGSRRVFLWGMLLFGGASVLGFASPSIGWPAGGVGWPGGVGGPGPGDGWLEEGIGWLGRAIGGSGLGVGWLLLARAGQGIGAALAMPAGIAILSRHFRAGKEQQTAFGIFGAFAAVGFAGGLALGGLISAFLHWRWIFGINVPFIALVVTTGFYTIPGDALTGNDHLDGRMAVWLTATLLLFSYGVHESVHLGWKLIPCLSAAILSGMGMIWVDRQQPRPFFGRDIYTRRSSVRALAAFALLGAGFLPFVFTCTLGLQNLMGWNTLSTGLLLFPYSIGSALVSRLLLPLLYRRLEPVQVGILSMGCLLVGDLLLAAGIHSHWLGFWLGALLLVNSVCIAIGYPAFTVLSLEGVSPAKQGVAAGLQSSLYTVGSGLGLSLTSLCLEAWSGGASRVGAARGSGALLGGSMLRVGASPGASAALGGASPGASGTSLLACCAVIGLICLTALLLLVRKPKNAYICSPI